MKYIAVFFLISLILGCGSANYIEEQGTPKHKIHTESLPKWVHSLPSGIEYVVGISKLTYDEDKCIDAAKQMAAVMMSRNKSSFSIDKFAIEASEDVMQSGKASFTLNVSASPNRTNRIYNELVLIDSVKYQGNFIGLFSTMQTQLPAEYNECKVASVPDIRPEIEETKNNIVVWTEGSSADLTTAWEKAADNGRTKIAGFLSNTVSGSVVSMNELTKKNIAVETSEIIKNLKISESFIQSELYVGLPLYRVYHKMTMEKK